MVVAQVSGVELLTLVIEVVDVLIRVARLSLRLSLGRGGLLLVLLGHFAC